MLPLHLELWPFLLSHTRPNAPAAHLGNTAHSLHMPSHGPSLNHPAPANVIPNLHPATGAAHGVAIAHAAALTAAKPAPRSPRPAAHAPPTALLLPAPPFTERPFPLTIPLLSHSWPTNRNDHCHPICLHHSLPFSLLPHPCRRHPAWPCPLLPVPWCCTISSLDHHHHHRA